MIKLYILLGIIILYILFILYCKIFYRFWSTQPVFHFHNLYYWVFPPVIIQHSLPPITKFYDHNVEFNFWSAISDETKEKFYRLNKNYYLQGKTISYKPTRESILSYFKHHNDPCFLTLLLKDDPLFHYSKKNLIPRQTCIASLTSRPLFVFLHQIPLKVNYVDYLCVHKKHRKKGVAPKMIYSYYYHSRRNNDIVAYLFKREGIGTFITPMTVYNTYGFTLSIPAENPYIIKPLLINSGNFQLFYHYLQNIKDDYPCFIRPAFSNLKYLVEKKLLYIFILRDQDACVGCYVFRNPFTYYENTNASVDLIASHCSNKRQINNFIQGFYNCLSQIDYPYEYIIVENISMNNHIIKDISQTRKYMFKSHTSYYLYNFGYRPFRSKDVFLLT